MFRKILIANRGEIACRVIKTARKMGIATVAVYSDADEDALHVEMADEKVHLGPPPAAQSYLLIDKIIAACKQTGAEAVHPGYGFLSERAAFAKALANEKIVFIGPNPRAIEAMGDKIESKKFASAARVNVVPGYLGVIENGEEAVEIANEIGYPVMLKASAGGGGKGMRVAYKAEEVVEGFNRARSEAAASFGDDRVFVEKFIVNPRHIEIQVLGDKHGNVIHLNERECSIQRRNQKVVEEAPSPLLDEETRAEMGAQAVALAKAVDYDSAGTVEFVAGQDKSFYFLEMNTRLQVEHPVTELITGVDLVEQMIRVAAGLPLEIRQQDVTIKGWAVESRIYAEDPTRNFLPSIGRLVKYRPPREESANGITVRNDTGVTEGREISIHYDPMIAKLVTHGPTRVAAIDAQAAALDRFVIDGIRHNIPFLSSLMTNERWRSGKLSTGFIAEEYPGGFSLEEPKGELAHQLASVATLMDHIGNERKRQISGQLRHGAPVEFERNRVCLFGEQRFFVSVEAQGEDLLVRFAGDEEREHRVSSEWRPGALVFEGAIDGKAVSVQTRSILNGYELSHQGVGAAARVYTQREAELAAFMPKKKDAGAAKFLLCPMPGLVKTMDVQEGQEVKAGEALCMVEAMKMENVLRAERDATIKKILAKPGDSLAVDAVILEFA